VRCRALRMQSSAVELLDCKPPFDRYRLEGHVHLCLVLRHPLVYIASCTPTQAHTCLGCAVTCAAGSPDDDKAEPVSSRPQEPELSVLSDLATLTSLLALAPAFLLCHLPPEMHAMGAFLAAALLAVERLVGAVGDRASLLVCQEVGAALNALLKTAGAPGASGVQGPAAAGQQGGGSTGGCEDSLVQEWQQRLQEQQQEVPSIQQLLPEHHKMAAAAAAAGSSARGAHGNSNSSSQGSGQDEQLTEDQVLLLRVNELLSWSGSQQYADLMAAARPLMRVVRPGSANSSRSIKSA
jgi:hypothetical protein